MSDAVRNVYLCVCSDCCEETGHWSTIAELVVAYARGQAKSIAHLYHNLAIAYAGSFTDWRCRIVKKGISPEVPTGILPGTHPLWDEIESEE